MVIRRRPRETWKHTRWTYHRRAMTHYAQAAVAAVPVMVGLVTLSILAATFLVVAGEVIVFVLLPQLPAFRRHVDASLDRDACLRAAAARSALLCRMDVLHQRELEQLEQLASRVRGTSSGTGDETSREEWLGIDRLLAAFVRLAIAHRDNCAAFDGTGGYLIEAQIADVESVRIRAAGEQRAWAERRLAILLDRRETWRRARYEQTVLAAELATIGELVRWMFEQSALGRSVDAQNEVVDAVNAAANSGPVLRDLAALQGSEPVDPEILRLGRRGAADAALQASVGVVGSVASASAPTSPSAVVAQPPPPPQALAC
jgi:hypothetical protein